jgi:hypothetical protein
MKNGFIFRQASLALVFLISHMAAPLAWASAIAVVVGI